MNQQKVGGTPASGTRRSGATKTRASRRRAPIGGFDHASRGIVHAISTQRNMRFHIAAAVVVVAAGVILSVSALEFAVLALAIALVIAAEIINTAVEAVVDLTTEEPHPLARVAKDATAGAVLVCSAGAALAGVFVFYDEVYDLLARLLS